MNKIELARLDQVGRGATIKIAASNATAKSKAAADYVCDGTADDVEINAAMIRLGETGGCVELSEGTFNINSSIFFTFDNSWLKGQGFSTVINGTNVGFAIQITPDAPDTLMKLSDLSVTGSTTAAMSASNDATTYISFCNFYGNTLTAIRNAGVATITNCEFKNNGGYGVICTASSAKSIITNNRFINNAEGNFSDAGTDNVFENNAEVV